MNPRNGHATNCRCSRCSQMASDSFPRWNVWFTTPGGSYENIYLRAATSEDARLMAVEKLGPNITIDDEVEED